MNHRKHDCLHKPLIAVALAVCSPAFAQAPPSGAPPLEVVTVTATRVGESDLLRTPIAVTAFSDEYLEDLVARDVRDLVVMTPGLMISQNTDLAQIYIRGVGSNNVFAGADPSSTIHYDGVYLARPQSSFSSFLDVERIEVLRGPQGTLYGRNSVGGTINVISKRPSLDRFNAEGRLTLGNESLWRAEGYVSGPLVDETLAGSLALQRGQHDAYRDNIAPGGQDVDDEDVQAARGQLRWVASDAVEALVRVDYFRDETQLYSGGSLIALGMGTAPLAQSTIGEADTVAFDGPSLADREASGVALEVNVDISERWSLKSLSAYRDNRYDAIADPDATELNILRTLLSEDQTQLSQEVNLIGTLDRTQWFLGAYWLREDVGSTIEVQVRAANLSTVFDPTLDTDNWAVFGQVKYALTDRLSLTAGGRYTDESKDWLRTAGRYTTGTTTLLANLSLPMQEASYSDFTPRIGFEFTPSDTSMFYGSVSSGFKSGGFNITRALPGGYEPETLDAYELGWKSRFDGRTQLHLSAFHYDYEDLQVQAFIVPGTADITNAASANVTGAELELLARLGTGLKLGAGVAYLDAEYDSYPVAPIGGGVTIDASGNRLSNAPEWSANASAEYSRPFSSGTLRFTGEFGWKSEVFFTTANSERESQDSYGVANASVGFESASGRLSFMVWGRNLTDELYLTGAGTILNTTGRYGAPRTYGVGISMSY